MLLNPGDNPLIAAVPIRLRRFAADLTIATDQTNRAGISYWKRRLNGQSIFDTKYSDS